MKPLSGGPLILLFIAKKEKLFVCIFFSFYNWMSKRKYKKSTS